MFFVLRLSYVLFLMSLSYILVFFNIDFHYEFSEQNIQNCKMYFICFALKGYLRYKTIFGNEVSLDV